MNTEDLLHVKVYISKEEHAISDDFLKVYEPYAYQGTLDGNRKEAKYLRKQTDQCRFCKKTRAETAFTEETHLISRLVGNSGFYSHDECNECNDLFDKLESDFAASFGAERTFDHILPGRKAPSFESGNGRLGIKKMPNGNIILHSKGESSEDIKVDWQNGKAHIEMFTQPYRPEFIYRSLLKMALAMLPEEKISEYDLAFKFLLKPELYPELSKFKKAIITETQLILARPFGVIFKKKTDDNSCNNSEYVFCLLTGHFMFQLSIPYHLSNSSLIDDYAYLPAPYFQFNISEPHDDVIVSRSVQDLQSTERIKRDIGMHMQFPNDNLVGIDLGKDFLKTLMGL